MPNEVFISHSSKDAAIATTVCRLLEERGLRCWVARRDATPGRSWASEIPEVIRRSDAVVLIASEGTSEAPYVHRELTMAVDSGKLILTLRVTDAELADSVRFLVSTETWVDAWEPPLEQHMDRLAAAIKALGAQLPAASLAEGQETAAQRAIVDRAIQDALGLAQDAPVLEQQRRDLNALDLTEEGDFGDAGMALVAGLTGLRVLSLACTQVGDAGLAHLANLTNLQRLDLVGTQVTNAGLVRLTGLTSLEMLWLNGTRVGDSGLAQLAGLTRLQAIWLWGTPITDAGLAHLAGLTNLQRVELDNTQVTDAGLAHLAGLTNLQALSLWGCEQITAAGVQALQRRLPGCRIGH